MSELKLYVRQLTIIGKKIYPGQPIYYAGSNPQTLGIVQGSLPANRQWSGYPNFIDVTDQVSDLFKLTLTWSIQRETGGGISTSNFVPKKSVSGTLSFTGQSYQLLRKWLIDDVSAAQNSVDVQIEDVGCGRFVDYQIKSSDLTWCEDGLCQFDVTLKQQDENITCIKRTLIGDNSLHGWFKKVPDNGKKHPRFSYCNEVRPNGTLTMEWYVLTSVVGIGALIFISIMLILNSIIFLINGIINTINAIISIVGGTPFNNVAYYSLSNFLDGAATIYIESSGCGREHPSPLIKDYITNVCDICGVQVDETTAPIFYQTITTTETSTGPETYENPYVRACYFNAPVRRGLRRFRRASITAGFQDPNNEYYIPDNQPLKALDQFLDEICPAFNQSWRIENNKLYIQRKDFYISNSYVYDFTTGSPDRKKIVNGICFTPNGNKYPAYVVGIYAPDASDTCGNEAGNVNGAGQMQGILSFGDVDNNPNFDGFLDKTTKFGATKFRFDGASGDYIYDAFQVIMNGGAFSATGIPGTTFTILSEVASRLSIYADYALLLSGDTAVQPKILIWDGATYENARAVKGVAAWPGVSSYNIPGINPVFNAAAEPWNVRHYPQTDVIGRQLTLPASPNGVYQVTDIFGNVIAQNAALLINFPMYFEPFYKGTLWDKFHWIDDPRKNPKMNMSFSVKIKLCCDDIKKLGVMNNSGNIALGQKIKLPFGFYTEGVLKEIVLSFEVTGTYGEYIELSGDF